MIGNVANEEVEAMIAARLANLKRLYAKDGRMSRYHKIKELEIIVGKIKEMKNVRGFKPNNEVLPENHGRGFSGFC